MPTVRHLICGSLQHLPKWEKQLAQIGHDRPASTIQNLSLDRPFGSATLGWLRRLKRLVPRSRARRLA